jgi:16S rRNA G966 N2-methylase RsmD
LDIENTLNVLKEAAEIAENQDIGNAIDFALKNPLKLSTELLRAVLDIKNFKNKIHKKVPDWSAVKGLLGPSKVSVEQASSSFTGFFKANLVPSNAIGVDLTGGLGVDSFYFAKKCKRFSYNERDQLLTEIVKHNFEKLSVDNVIFYNDLAENFFSNTSQPFFDFVYLDPHRRDSQNKKMVSITDCEPNLVALMPEIYKKTSRVLVKYSPMLDIKAAIIELNQVDRVYILSERNEVKELVFDLSPTGCSDPEIHTINLSLDGFIQEFMFHFSDEELAQVRYDFPSGYLFEPNASIMKAGAFKSIANRFGLAKLALHSHLYTSGELVADFPGRIFKIVGVCGFNKAEVNSFLPYRKANVSCRNFPYKPEEVKKRLGIVDGGHQYLFCTENMEKKKIIIICEKLSDLIL